MEASGPPPLSEGEIHGILSAAWDRMSTGQRRFWKVIRVTPAKWQQQPWGDHCGGFWVAGVIGEFVVWYNEIEEGFNLSRYSRHGTIDEYWADQNELEWVLERLLDMSRDDGTPIPPRAGPPESV